MNEQVLDNIVSKNAGKNAAIEAYEMARRADSARCQAVTAALDFNRHSGGVGGATKLLEDAKLIYEFLTGKDAA